MSDQLTIERVGGFITLTGRLDKATVKSAEQIQGSRFISTGPKIVLPLSLSACKRAREIYGERLFIGPELREWARDQAELEATLGDLAGSTTADLHWVSERIDEATMARSYQRVAAAFIAATPACLIADQPGLGKCLEVLAGAQEANPDAETRYHLVLAPSIAVSAVWPGEVAHWCGAENAVAYPIRGTAAERHAKLAQALCDHAGGLDVYVLCNLEMARIAPVEDLKGKKHYPVSNAKYPELFDRVWDTVIIDEEHRALVGRNATQVRKGLAAMKSDRRIALSGTPLWGNPVNLWGVLNWLRPDLYPSYWRWVEQYWNIYSTRYSNYNVGDFLPGGEEKLASDLRAIMLRRTKAEVLPELPPILYAGTHLIPGDDYSPKGIWLEMTATQRKRYTQFVNEGTVEMDGGWVIANGTLAERTRQIQLCSSEGMWKDESFFHKLASPKFDWLVDFLDRLGHLDDPATAERVVVASYSTDFLKVIAKGLETYHIPCHLLTGETSDKSREAIKNDFQSDSACKRVFLLNGKAGGVALTLDAADYVVELDESTIPDEDEQVEMRVHRTSRIHQVTVYKLRMLDTIEEEIAWIAAANLNTQKYILDGTRGVGYARDEYLARQRKD